jgi:hypothetical protein
MPTAMPSTRVIFVISKKSKFLKKNKKIVIFFFEFFPFFDFFPFFGYNPGMDM